MWLVCPLTNGENVNPPPGANEMELALVDSTELCTTHVLPQ